MEIHPVPISTLAYVDDFFDMMSEIVNDVGHVVLHVVRVSAEADYQNGVCELGVSLMGIASANAEFEIDEASGNLTR